MKTASNGGLGSAEHNNARTIWYSSFEEIIKHMKRTPISGLLGDPQILAKLCKTTKNCATRTLLNAIPVHFVVTEHPRSPLRSGKKFPPRPNCQVVLCVLIKKTSNKNFMISQRMKN